MQAETLDATVRDYINELESLQSFKLLNRLQGRRAGESRLAQTLNEGQGSWTYRKAKKHALAGRI